MNTHTAVERRLKADINDKNILRKEMEKDMAAVRRWKATLDKTKSLQKQKKLMESITRYEFMIDTYRAELIEWGEELEDRIREEMAYSEEEVKAFQADLDKHLKEVKKIEADMAKAEKEKKGEEGEGVKPAKVGLNKLLKSEIKKIQQDQKELQSEERDKALFTLELKRIAVERELYGE